MNGWELRERRRAAGLTAAQVARAAGTAETNVAAYERGIKRPSSRTLSRLVAVIDSTAAGEVHAHDLLTVPAAAAAIRRGLRATWSTADLLRLVRQMRSDFGQTTTMADRSAFLAEPSTTGDQRWDAMLAGNAEDLALSAGLTPPGWTAGHGLPTFWFVGSTPSLGAYAFARSPFSLQIRGVMVDPGDLEAV
ncbi:helix-turn-helix domain-containing protein [Spongisporangium articulatum]|uniref:Helix-turn-helix domain-containing protein n=1 Tax=Spongisporangium articulatum TaxID=3362603 RepID=A0ABW8AHG1_9ACTN